MGALAHAFFEDTRVQIALLLLVLDFGLGTISGIVAGKFRLSYLADTLKTDVLGKVLPFFLLYAGYLYAGSADLVIPGFDIEILMNAAWVVLLAALGGSALNSLRDLGLLGSAPDEIAGPDPTTPE